MSAMTREKLIDMMWEDVGNNYTPDMHRLRYAGPIPVFLYGTMSDWTNINEFFKKHGCQVNTDWRSTAHTCQTEKEFLALKADKNTADVFYPDIIVKDTVDLDHEDLTKLPVRGRIIEVSLKGLKALDLHYYNEYRGDRKYVSIVRSDDNKNHNYAYTYIFPVSSFCVKEHGVYSFRDGLDFNNFETKLDKLGEVYHK